MTVGSSMAWDRIPVPSPLVDSELFDNEVLLYHPRLASAVYLNPTAAVVWGLCDGSRRVGDIIALIEHGYPDAQGSIVEDVEGTIESLKQEGMIDLR